MINLSFEYKYSYPQGYPSLWLSFLLTSKNNDFRSNFWIILFVENYFTNLFFLLQTKIQRMSCLSTLIFEVIKKLTYQVSSWKWEIFILCIYYIALYKSHQRCLTSAQIIRTLIIAKIYRKRNNKLDTINPFKDSKDALNFTKSWRKGFTRNPKY